MFTVQAILKQVPITYRQLDSWAREGIIHPVRNGGGQGVGNERMFLGPDYLQALWTARLVKAGVELHTAARIAYQYISTMPHPALSGYMVEMGPGISMYLVNEGDFNREYRRLEQDIADGEALVRLLDAVEGRGGGECTEGQQADGVRPSAAPDGSRGQGDRSQHG